MRKYLYRHACIYAYLFRFIITCVLRVFFLSFMDMFSTDSEAHRLLSLGRVGVIKKYNINIWRKEKYEYQWINITRYVRSSHISSINFSRIYILNLCILLNSSQASNFFGKPLGGHDY